MNAARTAGYTQNFFHLLHELHNLLDEIGDNDAVGVRIQRCLNLLDSIDQIIRTQNWAFFQNKKHCFSYVLEFNIILQFKKYLRIYYYNCIFVDLFALRGDQAP